MAIRGSVHRWGSSGRALLAVAAGIALTPMAVAHADDGSYTAELGGETIGKGVNVTCKPFDSYGSSGGAGVKIRVGQGVGGSGSEKTFWAEASIGNEGPEVYSVSLNPLVGADTTSPGFRRWAAEPNIEKSQASVSKTGNTYRITGTVAPVYQPGEVPKPFEFEVTCP